MEKIKIAIIDDQRLFRRAIASTLSSMENIEVVVDTENGRQFIEQLPHLDPMPEIVILDLDMPEMNGLELNRILHAKYPFIKSIILSVFSQERFISKMIEEGANGYLAKNCDVEELIAAINTVHKTDFYFNADCIKALQKAVTFRINKHVNVNNIHLDLTERELDILLLICKEFTNAEIAEKLFLSIRTIEGHRNNLLTKVGCRNTAGLVIFAIRRGIYQPWLS